MTAGQIFTVTGFSAAGDGKAEHEGRVYYFPGTAPGDRVSAVIDTPANRARISRYMLIEEGESRRIPPCPYYGLCGGCALLHVSESAYDAFKDGKAARAAPEITPLPPARSRAGGRRRADFACKTGEDGAVSLGFFARKSGYVADIPSCLVCTPAINALLPALKEALSQCHKPGVVTGVSVTDTEAGADILFKADGFLAPKDTARLKELALREDVARVALLTRGEGAPVTLAGETVYADFSGVRAVIPPGAFLQATAAGAAAIADFIADALQEADTLADLYCGCGPYALPAAKAGKRVVAYEGSSFQTEALKRSAAEAGVSDNITAVTRDLYKKPVTAKQLSGFDAAIINPPRNGALPQYKELAASGIPKIICVSCSPDSFTRDAKLLRQKGYRPAALLPVDQFYGNAHMETVALMRLC